jgi:xanthine dehydrogenase accessory factor
MRPREASINDVPILASDRNFHWPAGPRGRVSSFLGLISWLDELYVLKIDARTAVVALTHGAVLDDEALRESLRASCLYIGALGSKKTHAKRLERLRAEGISEEDLARIRAPVGLSIGAKGPAEIAVPIIAEIVKASRGGL